MKRHLTILTGASRGLGLALTEQLLLRGHRVLAMARQTPALAASAELVAWSVDLADPQPVATRLARWLAAQDPDTLASATLINNAGVTPPPAPLQAVPPDDLSRALRVGLEAPLLLSAAFLRATAAWGVPRKVLLISSGLGRRAMAGAAVYCAAKAGMDHLARVLALEEHARPDGARVVSLAPGIIDTDMQAQLRGADPVLFPERARFVDFQRAGQLDTPAEAAAKVLAVLDRSDFGSQPVADVRHPG